VNHIIKIHVLCEETDKGPDTKTAHKFLQMDNLKPKKTSDHLANERTFLAWVRTSIAIMAFGFVVAKFSLFVKQFTTMLGTEYQHQQRGFSAMLGIILVVAGMITCILAFFSFKKTEKEINEELSYKPSIVLYLLVGFIFLISILLIVYLVEST
jgi:putative membrane protein